MLKIDLLINGVTRTFAPSFISGRVFRNTMKMTKLSNSVNELDENTADEIAKYICDVFQNQFTIDELYDGLDARDMIPKFLECIAEITSKAQPSNVSPN